MSDACSLISVQSKQSTDLKAQIFVYKHSNYSTFYIVLLLFFFRILRKTGIYEYI